jgi:hypothetical protein
MNEGENGAISARLDERSLSNTIIQINPFLFHPLCNPSISYGIFIIKALFTTEGATTS